MEHVKLNYSTWHKFSMSEMYTARWIDIMEWKEQGSHMLWHADEHLSRN